MTETEKLNMSIKRIAELEKGLNDIIKHLELSGGSMARLAGAGSIARKALGDLA